MNFEVHTSYTSATAVASRIPHRTSFVSRPQPTAVTYDGDQLTRLATAIDLRDVDRLRHHYSNHLGWLPMPAIFHAARQQRIVIARDHGVFAGYALLSPQTKSHPELRTLVHLAVAPQLHHRGHGERLVNAARALVLDNGGQILQAWTRHDLDANGFFHRLGWIWILSDITSTARRWPRHLRRVDLTGANSDRLYEPPATTGQKRHSLKNPTLHQEWQRRPRST